MKRRITSSAIAAALAGAFASTSLAQMTNPLQRTHAPRPTTGDITVEDVRTRTYIIADDSMEGRDTGRRGGERSAQYIARELKRLGLQPAGDNGTYLQQIPWIARAPDTSGVLRVGDRTLRWGSDYLVLPKLGFALALGGQPFGAGFRGENVATVYGGRIGDGTLISPDDARGKIVVFASPTFAFWQRDNLRRYAGARAVVVATLDQGAPPAYKGRRETYWDSTGAGVAPLAIISVTRDAAAEMFASAFDQLAVGTAGRSISGNVGFIDSPTEAPAYNVVGIIRGSDPKLRNTYVAVGSHHDHVGVGPAVDHDSIRAFNQVVRTRGADDPPPQQVSEEQWTRIRAILDSLHRAHGGVRRDSIFNGADDDGSGSVLALEIAEAFATARVKPKHSLLFVWHTAEEKGLYGAQYYADHPTVPRDSIIAQVNMDQMGRGDPIDNPPGGPNALVIIGARRLSTELGDLVETVNARPENKFVLDYQFDKDGDPTNAYCRSDHYMYARYGIPVAFFVAAAWYIDYHMVSDEPQYVAYDRMTHIGRFIRNYVGEVANLPGRPNVDKPKPDPNGLCRQ
jgi:hypothetical protein